MSEEKTETATVAAVAEQASEPTKDEAKTYSQAALDAIVKRHVEKVAKDYENKPAEVKPKLELLDQLQTKVEASLPLEDQLKKSNEEIWDMGDKIREYGEKKDFGPEFAEVAYGIHLSNDKRAAVKKEINLLLGSSIIEEKSYKDAK